MGPRAATETGDEGAAARPRWRSGLEVTGALLVYLVLAGWLMADVLPTPSTRLIGVQGRPTRFQALGDSDQSMVLANVTSAARSLVSDPAGLWDNRQCYPFPNPRTLGEPMIVDGMLAAAPLAVTGEPILAMNAVYLLRIVAAGAGMFLLIRYCTGSAVAAFIAGLLFGFEPHRIRDLSHPYIASSVLAPLAILLAVRLVETRRWRVATALGVVLGLQVAESFYPTVALGIVGGCCGVGLLVHARHRLLGLAPRLAVVAALALIGAVTIYGPFMETRAMWSVLAKRSSILDLPAAFGFGGKAFPGVVVLALAGIGLVDRIFGGRDGVRDLRIPLAVGGALVFWLVVVAVPVPLIGPVPSPYYLGLGTLPGFDSVRVVTAIRVGVYLAAAALAGFGAATVLRRRRPISRVALGLVLSGLAAGELFAGKASGTTFATRYEANLARPSSQLLAALDRLPAGPVANVPTGGRIGLDVRAHALLLSAFHGRAVDTCNNSFVPIVRRDVERLVQTLPAPAAIVGLAALGFEGVILHTESLGADRTRAFRTAAAARTDAWATMTEVAEAEGHVMYALASNRAHTGAARALARAAWPPLGRRPQTVSGPSDEVELPIYNPTSDFFVVTRPIEPLTVVVTWRDASDRIVSSERLHLAPPVVIAPRRWDSRTVPLAIPTRPGRYTLAAEVVDDHPWEISRVPVIVRGAAGA